MLQHLVCDLFDSGADLICHQVNCQGVMGAGLARQIRFKYPHVFEAYKKRCVQHQRSRALLGTVQAVPIDTNKYIVNIFGQWRYGTDRQHTDYNALECAFNTLNTHCRGRSIAIPFKMGCNLGGGDWQVVQALIDKCLHDCTVYICKRG